MSLASELEILVTTFLTVLTGSSIFILGNFALRLVIEPVLKLRSSIGRTAHTLSFYSNIYSNPGNFDEETNRTVSTAFRNVAAELKACEYEIFALKIWAKLTLIPKVSSINDAYGRLLRLSNSIYKEGDGVQNAKDADEIRKRLKILQEP